MAEFWEKHGTVLLLYSLVVGAFVGTIFMAFHAKVDAEKIFDYGAGFTSGAFGGLTLAMRVTGMGSASATVTAPNPSSTPTATATTGTTSATVKE